MVKKPQRSFGLMKRQNLLPLKIGAGSALAVLILAVFSLTSLQHALVGSPQLASVISAVLVDLANADRQSQDIRELTVSPILTEAAQAKANDMATKGYFAHVSPQGLDSWYWFREAGYPFTYAGENLAVDFSDSADVEKAWMNSPTHRANLLNSHFTQIGIATAVGTYQGRTTTFVVQMFGTPAPAASAAVAPAIRAVTVSPKPTEIAIATTEATPTAEVLGVSAPRADTATVSSAPAVLGDAAAPSAAAPEQPVVLASQAPVWGLLATSPKTTLRYAYYLLGLFILMVLVARTGIEIKLHHSGHIVIALSLIVLMFALFFIADHFVFLQPIVPSTATSTQAL